MNIQKIFDAVTGDDMNSPLPSIVWEFEQQGYQVKLEEVDITANDMDDNLFIDLEKAVNEFNFNVQKNNQTAEEVKIVFTGYHEFNIYLL